LQHKLEDQERVFKGQISALNERVSNVSGETDGLRVALARAQAEQESTKMNLSASSTTNSALQVRVAHRGMCYTLIFSRKETYINIVRINLPGTKPRSSRQY
jgi:hypothetical protein